MCHIRSEAIPVLLADRLLYFEYFHALVGKCTSNIDNDVVLLRVALISSCDSRAPRGSGFVLFSFL
jgi:hypothetical protein